MSKRKYLIAVPRGGLGNRLRVVASALGYAQYSGRKVIVVWQLTPELNCRYEELFCTYPALTVVNAGRIASSLQETLCNLAAICQSGIVDYYDDATISVLTDRITGGKGDPKRLVVTRVNGPFFRTTWSPDWFVPVPGLQQKIDDFCRTFTEHTVGVHIRRTDNTDSVNHSKTEAFVEIMRARIHRDRDTKFFLATDCPATEALLRDIFEENIIFRKKSLDRNDNLAIKDALVDMYCLANTHDIIGSYWSSFSEVSALLGRVPLEIVYSHE